MKMTVFLLLAACLQVSAKGYSQKISLSVREASLGQVFKEIQRQSGYSFWYKTKQLDQAAKVTLDLKNASLEEALRQCFKDQPFDYFIVEQNVVIRPRLVIAEDIAPLVQIKGKVTTTGGKPLGGVSVTVKSTKKRNDDGRKR